MIFKVTVRVTVFGDSGKVVDMDEGKGLISTRSASKPPSSMASLTLAERSSRSIMTVAELSRRFTTAWDTPGTSSRARVMEFLQAAHVIPETENKAWKDEGEGFSEVGVWCC